MDICQFHSYSEEPCNEVQITNSEYVDEKNVTNIYEETSNCELRFISNEEMDELLPPLGEYEELTTVKQLTTSCNNYCKLYKTFADTSINSPLENTDDQLFIEIVKEDTDESRNLDKNKSILDSISFNIEDHEETIVKIKITNTDNGYTVKDSSKFVNWKPPEMIANVKKERKARSPRKPLQLANYCDLITDAINSSPEKRMILTEIYDYIMEHVPFFKDIDQKGKDGWKNCVRHTLSVNKKFIRIKNTSKCRFSYWTVCEGGDFETQFAQYSWVSEIYKPEERKRKIIKRNTLKSGHASKDIIKPSTQPLNDVCDILDKRKNDRKYSTRIHSNENQKLNKVKNGKNKPAKYKLIEHRKPVVIKTNSKKVEVRKSKRKRSKHKNEFSSLQKAEPQKTTKRRINKKKPSPKEHVDKKNLTDMIKKKQPTRTLRVLPERLSRKAEKFSQQQETEIRRSSRKKPVRKSWHL